MLKKRWNKNLAGFLVLVMVLQCFGTSNIFADEVSPYRETAPVSVSTPEAAPENTVPAKPVEETTPETPASDASGSGNETPAAPVSDGAAAPVAEEPSEGAAVGNVSEDSASKNPVSADSVSTDSVSVDLVSGNEAEEAAGDENPGKKAVTVMLYQIGCDLERGSGAARKDISEIMKGIDGRTNKDKLAPSINFIVETGGMKRDLPEWDAYKAQVDALTDKASELQAYLQKIKGKESDYSMYTKNQRWMISGDSIELLKDDFQPSDQNRPMNQYNGEGVNEELLEFIDTTTANYPADQYILIFWDHGSGPRDGFGNDERDSSHGVLSDHMASTMAKTKVFGEGKKKLAWIGYDACLMANVETALTWAPYARYFSGSEELEGNDGWNYVNWVTQLCEEAEQFPDHFTNDVSTNEIIAGNKGVAQNAVFDFYDFYKEDGNATQSLVSLNEIAAVQTALADYAGELSKLFMDHPVEAYRALRFVSMETQGFGGHNPAIKDLKDFIINLTSDLPTELKTDGLTDAEISAYNTPIIKKTETLISALGRTVISENHTDDYGDLGGLTVYLPHTSVIEEREEGRKDDGLKNYRRVYENAVFREEPYGSLMTGLDPWRDLLGLYHSILNSGAVLADGTKTEGDVSTVFRKAAEDYEVSDKIVAGNKFSEVSKELVKNRIQNEAVKISDNGAAASLLRRDFMLFGSFDQHLCLERENGDPLYLGYIPGGKYTEDPANDGWKQDLFNYKTGNWFGVDTGDKIYPMPLYSVDFPTNGCSQNAFSCEVDITVPVAGKDGGIFLLDINFAEGSQTGTLKGMWPYSYEYGQFGRYVYNSGDGATMISNCGPFSLLGNVLESIEGRGIGFDHGNWRDYAYGEVASVSTADIFKRDCPQDSFTGISEKDKIVVKDELIDVFGSSYEFGKAYKESMTVSLKMADDVSGILKGTALKETDIRMVMTNSKGEDASWELSEDIPAEDTMFCLYDDRDKQIPLSLNGGYLCTVSGDGKLYPYKVTGTTRVFLKEDAVSTNFYGSIEGANLDINDSFELKFGNEYIDIPVYDTEKDKLSVKTLDTPLYYLAYKYDKLDNKKAYSKYFRVDLGGLDVTTDSRLTLKFGVKDKDGKYVSGNTTISGRNLKPGDEIAVYAAFKTGEEDLAANNEDSPLTLRKSPAKIKGTVPVSIPRLGSLVNTYKGTIEVTYLDADNKAVTLPDNTYKYTSLKNITKNNGSTIDTKGIDKAISGNYQNINLSPDGGWLENFTELFEVREFILGSYSVYPVTRVRFLSSTDRKELCSSVTVSYSTAAKDGRVGVSDNNAFSIKGSLPVEWYYKTGDPNPAIVFQDGKPVKYGKGDGVALVEYNKNGKWLFYLPQGTDIPEVIFYAGYAAEAKNEGDIEVKIDPITPVEYTGRNIVTTKSTKTGSKVLGLVIRSADGEMILQENTDYTVSYKNNKNVSDIYDRKPPTVIIKGKNAYKGLKYTINFTILPADLSNAAITLDRRYAPINSNKKKGVTLAATVTLPGGVKVPSNRYELHFYTRDENGLRTEVTREQLASYYKTDKVYPLYVSATATQPADQGSNFETGSRIDPAKEAFVYAYPKTTGKVAVTLKTKKYEYTEEGQKIEDIFKTSNIKTLKAGGKTVSIGQIEQPVEAYYDKKLTKPVYSDVLKDAGTYYLNVALTDTAKVRYRVFNSTPVQVDITGTKLKRSNIALMDTKIVAVSGNAREPESLPLVLRFSSDFKWKNLLVCCTQRDGGTVEYFINENDEYCYEENGMRYYKLTGVDNGAIGNYKLTVYGAEDYSGSVTYSYKVVAK